MQVIRHVTHCEGLVPGAYRLSVEFILLRGPGHAIMHVISMIQPYVGCLYAGPILKSIVCSRTIDGSGGPIPKVVWNAVLVGCLYPRPILVTNIDVETTFSETMKNHLQRIGLHNIC
jgi:hypothetical protein